MMNNETLNKQKEELENIISDINSQASIVENNLSRSTLQLKELIKDRKETQKFNVSIKRVISTAEISIKSFRQKRDKITQLLLQVNRFYDKKYLPLIAKIDDDTLGLKARLKQGTQFKNEITKLKESSKQQYTEVRRYATELRRANREITKIESTIKSYFQNSNSNNEKINSFYENSSKLDTAIQKIYTNLEVIFKDSKSKELSISNLLEQSKIDYQSIKEIKESSEKVLYNTPHNSDH